MDRVKSAIQKGYWAIGSELGTNWQYWLTVPAPDSFCFIVNLNLESKKTAGLK